MGGTGTPEGHRPRRIGHRLRSLRVWKLTRALWDSYQGIALLLLLVGALILGYVGYREYFLDAGEPATPSDLVYLDLQLLTFSTTMVDDPDVAIPPALQVARFLLPLVAGYSAIRALARLFRDRVDQVRARFRRRHTIVAGIGETGMAFVRALRADGHKVVVVDDDPTNPNLQACREVGALVLVVDARQPESLIQAGVAEAENLIAVCGDDGKNAEIVLNAQGVPRETSRPLHCLAHVVDADLWQLLRANELRTDDLQVRFSFFNIFEHGARVLLDTHPPFDAPDIGRHVLVLGEGILAERLVVQLGLRWDHAREGDECLAVTLLSPRASALRDKLVTDTPELGDRLRLIAVDAPLDGLALNRAADLASVDIAYVCVDTDSDAVVMAQALRHRLATAPIVVCLRLSAGLVRVLEDGAFVGPPGLRQIEPFALLDRTCHPQALLAGVHEGLAQAIHRRYRAGQLAQGASPDDPRLASWDDLSEDHRDSNRGQAADISDKLRSIGCDLIPQQGWAATAFTFTALEVDELARREHQRWYDERWAQGWRPGPERDDAKKLNPLLVAWDELPTEAQAQNEAIVLAIPDLVGDAGFDVVRVTATTHESGWIEPVARAIHERYRARRAEDRQDTRADVVWEDLPEALQASNRAQAVDIPTKLAAVGCQLAPAGRNGSFTGFTPAEIEAMARIEHDRWTNERTATGQDVGSPDLVGWDELPEPRRELDREAVRAIPEVLAVADLTVARTEPI